MHGLVIFFLILIKVVTSIPTSEDFHLNNIQNTFRLKTSFKPIEYTILLNFTEDILTTPEANKIYNSKTAIQFEWMNHTDFDLEFHADISYLNIKVLSFANGRDYNFYPERNCNQETQICVFGLPNPIPGLYKNKFTVVFESEVVVSSDLLGMYKSSYETRDGKTEYFIATQFKPTYARRVFPCLDEPSFKAQFHFLITTPQSSNFGVLTNTKNEKWITHDPQPEISTYLVAFVVSKFTSTAKTVGYDQTSHKVWARPGLEEYRTFSWKAAPEIMDEFGRYLNKNIASFGINKSDEVAVPNFGAALENLGLITFSEDLLLLNEKENSSLARQHTIKKGLVHQMAHMWFGDWVTLEWWDVTFLNEGFAKYFEYFLTNRLYPEFEMDRQFVVDVLQLGLEADENPSSPPLQSTCESVKEITSKSMDKVSQLKGACIVKMLKDIMSEDQFQKSLQGYIKENRNVRPTDLWTSLQEYIKDQNIVLEDIMSNWIFEAGFPLIQVDLIDENTVQLSQTNFRTGKPSNWTIPVLFETDKDKSSRYWFEDKLNITKNKEANWVLLKNSEGFYRVNYDDQLWDDLIKALPKEDSIDDLSKSQIVDDLFVLARARKMSYAKVFDYLDFLNTTSNYYIWKPAFRGFDFLLKRFGEDSKIGQQLISLVKSKLPYFDLTYAQSEFEVAKKSLEFEWQCRTGNSKATKLARDQFSSFLKDNQPVKDIDLREVVFCYGLKNEDGWEKLHDKYHNTLDSFTRKVILKSLSCGNDKHQKVLLKSTIEDKRSRQEMLDIFLFVLRKNVDVALDFFVENVREIEETYPPLTLSVVISSLGDALFSKNQITKFSSLEDFLSKSSRKLLSAALKVAEKNLEWTETVEKELIEYFGNNSSNSLHLNLYLAAILFIVCLF